MMTDSVAHLPASPLGLRCAKSLADIHGGCIELAIYWTKLVWWF